MKLKRKKLLKKWYYSLRTAIMLVMLYVFAKLLLQWSWALWAGVQMGKRACE